jgi:hypothetical protein
MKLIPADHNRRIDLPGVPEPVLRPVDIDKAKTGFESLRSLRIYHFDAASAIDGHAEEDEVMIVLLAGSIEITLIDVHSTGSSQTHTLSAVTEQQGAPCAAYLPPHAAYRLLALTGADVAYARATPETGPLARAFYANPNGSVELLWEELTYPKRLRVRVLQVRGEAVITPIAESESGLEALVHVRAEGDVTVTEAGSSPNPVSSWATVAVYPGERPALQVAKGAFALVLVVLALPA